MAKKILIVVASENPVKLQAAEDAFMDVFLPEGGEGPIHFLTHLIKEFVDPDDIQVKGVSILSGVSDQPMNESETLQGARNRMVALQNAVPYAHYYVSMEGGVVDNDGIMEEIGYILVTEQGGDRFYRGQIPRFEIPFQTAEGIRQGREMGPVNDQLFGLENSKQAGGMAGIVTDNLVDRYDIYHIAAQLAFSALKNSRLYEKVPKMESVA